jgi:putative ABC transport system permease protein
METLIQDLRYGVRSLRKQPGFTLVAVLTLAIGIGANTAIFSVVNATLLRPFPFKDLDRLMRISLTTPPGSRGPGSDDMVWSYPKHQTFRERQQIFEDIALYCGGTFNLAGDIEAERVLGEYVGASYLPLLGVTAEAGRIFRPEEDATPQTHFVALLGYGLWQRSFGGDPGIVGRTIRLDTHPHTVVGVLPAGFRGLTGTAEIWVPVMTQDAGSLGERWAHSYQMIGRLKPGVTVDQAKSAVAVLGAQVDQAHPNARRAPGAKSWGAAARTLNEARIDPTRRRSVLVLFGAVGFVLLIACVNIANLMLARAGSRRREIAIRLAVGASRWRLVRQLLTESGLLALAGALASLAFAYLGIRALEAINPAATGFGRGASGLTLIGFNSIGMDASALVFTFALGLLTGLLFGLVPALQATRTIATDALKDAGSQWATLSGLRRLTGRNLLVVAEVALALVLLVGSGLMIKSLSRLLASRTGVDPTRLLSMRINLPTLQYGRDAQLGFFEQLESRVAGLPGVQAAGTGNCPPLSGGCNGTIIWFRDRPEVTRGAEPSVGVHWITPDYLKTMRVPLLRGRTFAATDRTGAPKVVLINETAARKFWPGEDPIGKPIAVGQGGFGDRAEIVGIVADIRYGTMDSAPMPDVFIPLAQSPRSSMVLFIRTTADPRTLAAGVRAEVRTLDRNLPVYDLKTMTERVSDATSSARFSTILLGVFGAIALVLSAIGVYGVLSYAVTQRTHEIGIRIALGAEARDVLTLVLSRGLVLTAAGIVLGVAVALASTRVLTTLLYEVKPSDPPTYIVISGVLGLAALVASYIPARRATRVDPLIALRSE